MEKRKTAIFIAIVGLFIIIICSTSIKFSQSVTIDRYNYLNSNLISLAKKCIKEKKCNKTNVTLKDLFNNDYLNSEIKDLISDYTIDSYIEYPTYKVILIKAD